MNGGLGCKVKEGGMLFLNMFSFFFKKKKQAMESFAVGEIEAYSVTCMWSLVPNGLLQFGHFRMREARRSSTHSLQKTCPHVLMAVFLKLTRQTVQMARVCEIKCQICRRLGRKKGGERLRDELEGQEDLPATSHTRRFGCQGLYFSSFVSAFASLLTAL